jgi:hypothetical protein
MLVLLVLLLGLSKAVKVPETPAFFIAASNDNMLLIDRVFSRFSLLTPSGQYIGTDCGTNKETSLFLGVGTPCVYSVVDGVPCPGWNSSTSPTACQVLLEWELLLEGGGQSINASCWQANFLTVCFAPDKSLQSLQVGGEVSMSFSGTLIAEPPLSSIVFPAFLCECPGSSSSPGATISSRTSSPATPNSFIALVNEVDIMFVDLERNRATFWNQNDQPIGVQCGSSNSSAYVIALNSSCVSISQSGSVCPHSTVLNPCVHVDAFRGFSQHLLKADEPCISAETRVGQATLCLSAKATFLNYTIAGQFFQFFGVIPNVQAPDSVYPFVPANDCPCPTVETN